MKNNIHSLTEEPSIDTNTLERLVTSDIIRNASKHDRENSFPIGTFEKLHSLGWLQCFVPEEMGGSSANTTDLLWIARKLAYGSAGVFTSFLGSTLGITPILVFGSEQLKNKLLKQYADSFNLWSFCMTEPDAGTDVANIRTTAKRVSGGYILNGHKCFITNSSYSKNLVIFAKIPEEPRPLITAFYVPAESSGIQRGKPIEKMGQRASNTGEIFLDNVFVPNEHLIANEGDGLKILKTCISRSKTLISGAAVGVCDRSKDLTVNYLQNRHLYGKPLIAQRTIESQLAQLQTEVEASWLLACKAAATWDTRGNAVKESSMAKLFSTHTAVKYVTEAVELFGGYGYCKEYEIERIFRDVRVMELYEGATFVQQLIVAKEILPKTNKDNTRYKKSA